MIESKFHFYSLGIVAKDLVRGERTIEVTPIETVPYYDGPITSDTALSTHQGTDASGSTYSVKVTEGNTLVASWLNFAGTHREGPPDVVHGERVMLFQYADTDTFRWDTLGEDDGLRSRETIIWYFSNKDDKSKTINSPDNAYSVKVSTHDKEITINTNKSDSEPFAYQLKLDTKAGKFTIQDDDGNFIFLDSAAQHIKLQNRNESMLELIGAVINMSSNESINQTTKEWNVTTNTAHIQTRDITIDANNGVFNIQALGINGSTYTVSSNVTFTGGSVKHGSKSIGNDHVHKVIALGKDTLMPTF